MAPFTTNKSRNRRRKPVLLLGTCQRQTRHEVALVMSDPRASHGQKLESPRPLGSNGLCHGQ
ncbi:MAG: hypothetical protein AAFQ44_06315 [Pseudomonadota bacterium]